MGRVSTILESLEPDVSQVKQSPMDMQGGVSVMLQRIDRGGGSDLNTGGQPTDQESRL